MDRGRVVSILFAILGVLLVSACGAAEIELDLAKRPATKGEPVEAIAETVAPGTTMIRIRNLVPMHKYRPATIRRTKLVEPFDATTLPTGPWKMFASAADSETTKKGPKGCAIAIEKLMAEFSVLDREDSVRALLRGAPGALKDCPTTEVEATMHMLRARTEDTAYVRVAAGEEVIFTYSRSEGKSELIWTVRLHSQARGTWITTYGLGVVPDRDERYWLQPTANAGEYVVMPQARGSGEFKVLPAAFFSWLPTDEALEDWSDGPTVGFGVWDSGFGLFLGWSALYNTNVQFSAGASLTRVVRLSGEYYVGRVVSENLSEDQLHRETVWPAWYAGVTLRFGANPFEKAAEPAAAESDGQKKK